MTASVILPRPATRHAFTLIELMVVIGVIAALAALSLPVMGYAKNKAREAKTQALLGSVRGGLEKFKMVKGYYPQGSATQPSSVTGTVTSTAWNTTSVFGTSSALNTVNTVTDSGWAIVNHDLRANLSIVDPENFPVVWLDTETDSGLYYLRDAFSPAGSDEGQLLRYRPAKFYPFTSGATYVVDSAEPPNPDSYQLWSIGRNATDNYGAVNTDDLTNWTKR
jgi:prepilin-type N-terminal cleavage/methylation domain-containing protein